MNGQADGKAYYRPERQDAHLFPVRLPALQQLARPDAEQRGGRAGNEVDVDPVANCEVSSVSNSAVFKLRDRRSSVLMRGMSSFRLRAMLLSFTSWLAWMPNNI